MINIEQLYRSNNGDHFYDVENLVISNKLSGWPEYYWAGLYLQKFAPDGTYRDLIIETFEETFFEGLNYLSDKECYLEVVRILGRLYLEMQQYDLAINMLQMLVIRDAEVPDWVHLRFAYAQMHSDTAKRLVDEPQYLFSRLDNIDENNEDSVNQRNAVFLEFLIVCIHYHFSKGIPIDTMLLFMKATEYGVLHTEMWKDFVNCFPEDFGVSEPVQEDGSEEAEEAGKEDAFSEETEDTEVDFNQLYAEQIEEMKSVVESLFEKMHMMEDQINQLMQDNKNYKDLLAEKHKVIKEITIAEEKIDQINKNSHKGITRGHDLIDVHKKILVIGHTDVELNHLLGIVKSFGYEKDDFVFWDDYDKIKSYAERLVGGSFAGIIAGPMPHKVSDLGEYSSLIEKMKQSGYPHMEEARVESGKLKISKSSFKKALEKLTQHLIAIQ